MMSYLSFNMQVVIFLSRTISKHINNQDDTMEDSPLVFPLSVEDLQHHHPNHLQRKVVCLFKRCSFTLIDERLRKLTAHLVCNCTMSKPISSYLKATRDCCVERKGLHEFYERLQRQVLPNMPSDMEGNDDNFSSTVRGLENEPAPEEQQIGPGSSELRIQVNQNLDNNKLYGFNTACCGNGVRYAGIFPCGPASSLCRDRDKQVFWDAYHSSEVANVLLAKQLLDGDTKYMSPINLGQLRNL